jgi:hypothetical protein
MSSCHKSNGLENILKIGNELNKVFVIQSCQKIAYNALLIMIFNPVANFGDHPLVARLDIMAYFDSTYLILDHIHKVSFITQPIGQNKILMLLNVSQINRKYVYCGFS